MTDSKIWIVVPAYNEAGRLSSVLSGLRDDGRTIVVVDDGSTDATYQTALKHEVWVLRHSINCGQGAALQTGIDFALSRGAEVIVTFDADGQHSAQDLPNLIEPVAAGRCEVALGSRFLRSSAEIPWRRRWLLRAAVLFTRIVSRIQVTDTHNGLRAFSRRAAELIRIRENRMAHASEILDRIRALGLSYLEVPVHVRYSAETLRKGQSNWNALGIAGRFLLGKVIR